MTHELHEIKCVIQMRTKINEKVTRVFSSLKIKMIEDDTDDSFHGCLILAVKRDLQQSVPFLNLN